MLHFEYKGRNDSGKEVNGKLDAVSKEVAISILKRNNVIPTQINVVAKNDNLAAVISDKLNLNQPSLTDMILFSKQMYALLKSGIPIIRTMKIVSGTVKNERLESSLTDMVSSLEGGVTLGQSMRKHPKIFPSIMQALVDVGENTGSLDLVFQRVAEHLQREDVTKKQVKSATRYPMIVVIAISVAIAVINIVVVPAFKNFFDQFQTELPLPTRILVASSDFMVNYWYLILIVLVGGIGSWLYYINTERGAMVWGKYQLKLPLVGVLIEKSVLSRFARSFSLTSRTGVPLLDSISLIANTADNVYVSKNIMLMRYNIQRGESLATAALHTGMFPPLVMQMISIGEETGEIDRLLDEIADFYEDELDYELKRLGEAIEPILITFIAVLVLILALGVFLPMWDLSKVALGGH